MKELTIEQKARAYDEALSVALETYQTQPMYRAWLEKMFPELSESEDEEDEINLQWIIDEIEANKNQAPDYDLATYDWYLSWLKSLRPQNRWKPSDKHIRFLQAMVNDPNNASSESCQDSIKRHLGEVKEIKGGVGMNKKELAKQYADKKTIDCYNSRFGLSNHDLHVKKSYDLFTGYDIEQAYEDGFDKAVELAYEWLKNNAERYVYWMDEEFGNKDLLEDFKKYMEEQV